MGPSLLFCWLGRGPVASRLGIVGGFPLHILCRFFSLLTWFLRKPTFSLLLAQVHRAFIVITCGPGQPGVLRRFPSLALFLRFYWPGVWWASGGNVARREPVVVPSFLGGSWRRCRGFFALFGARFAGSPGYAHVHPVLVSWGTGSGIVRW